MRFKIYTLCFKYVQTYRLRKQEQQTHSIQRMEFAGEPDGKAIFIRCVGTK